MASQAEIQPPQSFTFVNGQGSIIKLSTAHIKKVTPTKDPRKFPPQAYTSFGPGPSFYQEDNMAWDLLSWIDLPATPCNLKPLIRCFEEEEPYEGKGKKHRITPGHDNEDMISLRLAVTTEEQIWDEVDAALMETINDPMGPVFNGRFDERYLFLASSQMHTEEKLTVPSSE